MKNKVIYLILGIFLFSSVVSGMNVSYPLNNSLNTNSMINIFTDMGNLVNLSYQRNGVVFNNDWIGYWSCNNLSIVGDSSTRCTDSINRQNFTISSYRYVQGLYGNGLEANRTGSGSFNPKTIDPILQQTLGNTSYSWMVAINITDVNATLCTSNLGGDGSNLPIKGFVEHRDARLSLGLDEGNKPLLRFGTSTGFTTDWTGNDIKFVYSNTTAVPFNEWHILGMTVNNSNKRLELYYDGLLVGNVSYTSDIDNFSRYDNSTYFGSNFASVCNFYGRGSIPEGATMDEWRTFNRALSPNEMAEQSQVILQKYSSNNYSIFINQSKNVLNNTAYNYSFILSNLTNTETQIISNVSFVLTTPPVITLPIYNVTAPNPCNEAYEDVLVIYTSTSSYSANVAQFYVDTVGACNILGVYNDNAKPYFPLGFYQTNLTYYTPIRNWLAVNGSNINYILLSTDIPAYTKENTYQAPSNPQQYYSHSLDSDIALIGLQDQYLWYNSANRVSNSYYTYNGSVKFNHSNYNFRIVTRIGGSTYQNATNWILKSKSFTKISRNNNTNAVLLNTQGSFTTDLRLLNQTLPSVGINVTYYNESNPAKISCSRNIPNNVYYTWYDPATSSVEGCWINATAINGSAFIQTYSFSGKINYRTMLVGNTTRETNTLAATDMGYTLAYGSTREPFVSGSFQQRYFAYNYVRDGMYYGDMAWAALPYHAWTQLVYTDPKASYPVIYYDSSSYQQVFDAINVSFYVQHPMSYNNPRFNISYNIYRNNVSIYSNTLNGVVQGNVTSLTISPSTAGTLNIVSELYMDGIYAGQFNQTIFISPQAYQCYGSGCVDFYTREPVPFNRSD